MPRHVLRTLAFNRTAHFPISGAIRILYPTPASRETTPNEYYRMSGGYAQFRWRPPTRPGWLLLVHEPDLRLTSLVVVPNNVASARARCHPLRVRAGEQMAASVG